MIVDDRSDAGHEGQSCRHVQVKMEGLTEPANTFRHRKMLAHSKANRYPL